jgi:uncharacterized linocin/CFP29 family protein
MTLTLHLTEDRKLRLDVDVEEWRRAYQRALAKDRVVEVENPRGGVLAINPHQVLYWVVPDEASVAA